MTKRMLNETLGTMEYDGLIYDGRHPADVKTVKIRAGQGELVRGTVLALSGGTGGDGAMVILGTEAGEDETLTPNCILAEPVDTGNQSGDALIGIAYRSGHFSRNKLVVKENYTFNAADEEELRKGGIYLSNAVI